MATIKGQLRGQASGYLFHAVELAFEAKRSDAPGTTPFSVRAQANDAGQFVWEVPDGIQSTGDVFITVYDPAGTRIFEQKSTELPSEDVGIEVKPGQPFVIPESDPFADAPGHFSGHIIARNGRG